MSDFEIIEEVGFPRHNRQTGEAEKLVIQLTRNDAGRYFVSMSHFWLKKEDGHFYPPSSKKTRIVFAGKNAQAEAAETIALLQKFIELQATPSAPPLELIKPGRGGVWAEAASGTVERHRDRLDEP